MNQQDTLQQKINGGDSTDQVAGLRGSGSMNRSPQETQTDQPRKIICVGDADSLPPEIDPADVVVVDTSVAVIDQLSEPSIKGVWISRDQLPQLSELRGVALSGIMLRDMPEGAALLDADVRVLWANRRLLEWANRSDENPAGSNFYELLSNPGDHGA